MLVAKALPPILGLAAACFTFLVVRRLHPEPVCAFLAAVLLSWYVWQVDDLATASPRSFILPILAAQVWALVTQRIRLAAALVVCAAVFHPVAGALGLALLGTRLVGLEGLRPRIRRGWSAWAPFLITTGLVVGLLLPGQLQSSSFGKVISVDQARAMPDFSGVGRGPFFVNNAYHYWIAGERSGFDLSVRDRVFKQPILFLYLAIAALLPLLLIFRRRMFSVQQLSGETTALFMRIDHRVDSRSA